MALRRGLRVLGWGLRSPVRMVDKNPKHCFRIPFLHAVFPDARFVFLSRGPRASIRSLIEGWRSERYQTYDMRGTAASVRRWSFDLPPGWAQWAHLPLPDVCAHQWVGYYDALLRDAAELPASAYIACRYERLVASPYEELTRIFGLLGLSLRGPAERLARKPPVVNAVSQPSADKWRERGRELEALAKIFDPMRERLGYDQADRPIRDEWI